MKNRKTKDITNLADRRDLLFFLFLPLSYIPILFITNPDDRQDLL